MTILSCQSWGSNAMLIEDCARLGYLRADARTLDPTYGQGTFWKRWRPDVLVCSDLHTIIPAIDFRHMPWPDRFFDCVVYDPPYKLNGTPSEPDVRYGCHVKATWQDRLQLCLDGLVECARVLGDGYLLAKCQDQVCSGKKRWQTYEFTKWASYVNLGLVDRFDFLSHRSQPSNRRQVHSHTAYSTLLVFQRGHRSDR